MKLFAIYITNNVATYGGAQPLRQSCCSFGSAIRQRIKATRLSGSRGESLQAVQ